MEGGGGFGPRVCDVIKAEATDPKLLDLHYDNRPGDLFSRHLIQVSPDNNGFFRHGSVVQSTRHQLNRLNLGDVVNTRRPRHGRANVQWQGPFSTAR